MSNNFHLQLYRGTTAQNNAYTGLAGEITADTQAGNIRLHDGSKAGGYVVASMPVGSIIPFAGTTIPDGYLLCDGSAISRTTYSSLFAAIGTTYGEGDGNSTFNMPNFNNRTLQGSGINSLGVTLDAGLPNITGTFNMAGYNDKSSSLIASSPISGMINRGDILVTDSGCNYTNNSGKRYQYNLNASWSNSIYGNSTTVQPPALVVNICIKY